MVVMDSCAKRPFHIYTNEKGVFFILPPSNISMYASSFPLSPYPFFPCCNGSTDTPRNSLHWFRDRLSPWDHWVYTPVRIIHMSHYPDLGHSTERLKRKFPSLDNHKKPTGDPNHPPHIHRAKRAWENIKAAWILEWMMTGWVLEGTISVMGQKKTIHTCFCSLSSSTQKCGWCRWYLIY